MIHKFLREKLWALVDKNSVVLDAGCGERNVLLNSSQVKELVGIDTDEAAIERNKHISRSCITNLEELDFENGEFDVVVSLNVIEHLERPEKFIKGVAKILRSGGHLYLIMPNKISDWAFAARLLPINWLKVISRFIFGKATANEVHYYRLNTVAGIAKTLANSGFQDISIYLLHQLPGRGFSKTAYYPDYLIGKSRLFPNYSSSLLCIAKR
jgi:2-polyprenyl-3-methyl-5-hydroxy-6-metoxy-1,4-benzoquinol methylase